MPPPARPSSSVTMDHQLVSYDDWCDDMYEEVEAVLIYLRARSDATGYGIFDNCDMGAFLGLAYNNSTCYTYGSRDAYIIDDVVEDLCEEDDC